MSDEIINKLSLKNGKFDFMLKMLNYFNYVYNTNNVLN